MRWNEPGAGLRISSLDGLRAVSILMVLLGHSAVHFVRTPLHRLQPFFDIASYVGVLVFFVISGYLITALLVREWDRTSRIDVKAFFRRRLFRILPASLFYIACISVLGHPSLRQTAIALSFTTTYFFQDAAMQFQHLWSLSVEEQFYLLWPLVFRMGKQSAKRYCWAVMIVAPMIRLLFFLTGVQAARHCFPAIADSLAAGCLLAFYEQPLRRFASIHLSTLWRFAVLASVTFGLASLLLTFPVFWIFLWGVIPCLTALCVIVAVQERFWLLNTKPIVGLGLLSYSLYLWQQPFLTHAGRFDFILVRLPLAFIVAYLCYRYVEKPMLRFRSKKPSDLRPAPALAVN